jgi:hypothetical protein
LRQLLWARFGAYVLVDDKQEVIPYSQPAMLGKRARDKENTRKASNDNQPVEHLSTGFFPLNCRPLQGNYVLVSDVAKLMHATHSTIAGIQVDDPTMAKNAARMQGYIQRGITKFHFVPMSQVTFEKIANERATVDPNDGYRDAA